MLMKSKLAIAAALVLGAASAAQAASENPSDPTRGFAYGPLGQRMGGRAVNPVDHLSTRHARGGAYAFVRPARVHTRNRGVTSSSGQAAPRPWGGALCFRPNAPPLLPACPKCPLGCSWS